MPTFLDPAFRGEAHETELIPPGVVEIRVHGVSGGSPEENLNDPHPIQVSGDNQVGFYRRRSELRTDKEPERTVEAYNWSAINSSSKERAWWVFLLPFALANLAGWLLPKGYKKPRYGKDSTTDSRQGKYEGVWQRPLAQIGVRLVGLGVTCIFVLGTAQVFIDLIGVQCGGSSVCYDRFWLGWLEWLLGFGDLSAQATRRAVVFALVPVGILAWIGWLGRLSGRYENYGSPTASGRNSQGPRMDRVTLREIEFWQAPRVVSIQRRLHLAAGFGLLAFALGISLRELSNHLPAGAETTVGPYHEQLLFLSRLGAGVFALSAVGLCFAHFLAQVPGRRTDVVTRILYYTGIAVLLAVVAFGWVTPAEPSDPAPLEAIRNGLIGVAAVGLGVIVVIGMLVRAFWVFLAIVGLGLAAFLVNWDSGTEDFVSGGSATWWLWAEFVIAVIGIVTYWRRGLPSRSGVRHASTAWIYVGLAAAGVCGLAAFMRERDRSTMLLAVAILVLYLFVQFAMQVRWGDDRPVSEKMRVGIPAVIAGLALTTALTLSSGATVFAAQRLGPALPHSGGPIVDTNVKGYIERAEVRITRLRVVIMGRLEMHDQESVLSQFDDQEVSFEAVLTAIDTQIRDGFIQVDNGVGRVNIVESGDRRVDVEFRLDVEPLAARADDERLVIRDSFVAVGQDQITVYGRAIVYPAEMGWYAITAVFGFLVFVLSVLLRMLALYLFRWGSFRGYWGPNGKAQDLSAQYDKDWTGMGGDDGREGKYDIPEAHLGKRKSFAKKATRARLFANMTDDADWLVSAGVLTTLALLVGVIAMRRYGAVPARDLVNVIGFASFAIAGAWIGLIWLVRQARDSGVIRRSVGVLWEVTAYFPRRFHPFAPPCYAEQSVIDIRDRIIRIREKGGRIALVSHSQGTLLTTTALMTLYDQRPTPATILSDPAQTGNELEGIYYITYGCMLQRLFGRAWPDQLPLSDLHELKRRLGDDLGINRAESKGEFPCPRHGSVPRWMNFGRYTDYLGGRVFAPLQEKPSRLTPKPELQSERRDDIFFKDPTRRWRYQGQSECARVWRHSFLADSDMEDPRFREHIAAVIEELGATG